MIQIRELHLDEVDFLSEMLYEAIFIPEGTKPLPRDIIKDPSLSKYIEQWPKDQFDLALVAVDDAELLGLVWIRLFNQNNAGYGFFDSDTPELSMALRSKHRGKGIGAKLLEALIENARQMGLKKLSLSVDKANRASTLYQRFGFEIIRENDTDYVMLLEL